MKLYLYHYTETTAMNTIDFIQRAISYYGYQPLKIQTDNGPKFTHIHKTSLVHPIDQLCKQLRIIRQRIRPQTPRHNGKVERGHRNDNERFYKYVSFYSLEDLRQQTKLYVKCSNNIAMATLGYLTPKEMRQKLTL